ncbi:tryptophan synthase subunit alpha [Chengkuizengella axinellae]|uniref:Tryptophan synthase alpha chain n=1 Tax=Chengkuizengella axinellae TaxID=3064388 RepID=A0ABT9IWV8_9BACL|nr:tryptophan synthase subunit alpha [Chengkuizengella sp. 2205SS18-9]MDP5273813.1 tryptophan synthase subunit alpha [Chengkuizengella sp. 2205SS18-9]
MNLIDQKFLELKEQNKTALIPFLTMGDPDVETSVEIIKELQAAGADIIELGVPYSDPLADGPVIQRASLRALQHNINIHSCLEIASKARQEEVSLPFILFTYYNPVLQFGLESFFEKLRENEISGVIIPDLPIEEDEQVRQLSERYGIHLVPLVAPTSNDRITKISKKAAGFVYCVSSLGVTGVRSSFYDGIDDFISLVKQSTDLPVAVGFGISTNEQFNTFSKICDGVVVGSAIVRKIEEQLPLLQSQDTKAKGLLQIREFVAQLKE